MDGACYSSISSSGEKQRGCLNEVHRLMQCGLKARQEYAIDCCYLNLCNNKVKAQLAPRDPLLTKDQYQLMLLIVVCIVSTGFVLLLAYGARRLFMWFMERKTYLNESFDASQEMFNFSEI